MGTSLGLGCSDSRQGQKDTAGGDQDRPRHAEGHEPGQRLERIDRLLLGVRDDQAEQLVAEQRHLLVLAGS